MAGFSAGQGGVTGGASGASGSTGDAGNTGNRAYGGINIGSSGGGFKLGLNIQTAILTVTAFAIYKLARSKRAL